MINIENLTKSFDKNVIFKNFTCKIASNELVAIMGRSGSGKSTLLNVVGLLDMKYEGKVEVLDTNIKSLKYKERRKFIRNNISYLFQNYALIEDISILDNLMLALTYTSLSKEEKEIKIKEALDTVKINKNLSTKIHTLSGGEQQRIAFARTLLKPSKIILADEPTGNLDEFNKKQIIELLYLMKESGKTIVIVTHDPEIGDSCERIINLD